MKPVAVLGAGIAGLTAARELTKRGLPAVVFEAGKSVGGMAASFKDSKGFSYDLGAHFVSNRLAEALGAADICRPVKRYGEAVAVGGKFYGYPFGLLRAPRFTASAAAARLQPRKVESAADWFRQTYGDALAQEVAIPLAEAWSGAEPENPTIRLRSLASTTSPGDAIAATAPSYATWNGGARLCCSRTAIRRLPRIG